MGMVMTLVERSRLGVGAGARGVLASAFVAAALAGCEPSPSRDDVVAIVAEEVPAGQPGAVPVAEAPSVAPGGEAHEAGADEAPVPPEALALDPAAMRAEQGLAWIVALPAEWEPFSVGKPGSPPSRLRLTEDGKELGPANSVHQNIREEGGGAHSHWQTALYFSSSDGSNPQTNGRSYVIELVELE